MVLRCSTQCSVFHAGLPCDERAGPGLPSEREEDAELGAEGGDIAIDIAVVRGIEHMFALEHRSEEHTSELQSRRDLVCRLLLEKKNSTAYDSVTLYVN